LCRRQYQDRTSVLRKTDVKTGWFRPFLIHPKKGKFFKEGNMKKLHMVIPLVILLCFAFSCQFWSEDVAEEKEPLVDIAAEKEAVLKVLEMVVDAEKRQDADATVKFFTDDVIVQPPDMPQIQGTQALYDLYTEFMFKMPYTSFDSKSTETIVSPSGDMAYDDGKIKELFAIEDYIGLYMQLGMELKPKKAKK